MVADHRLVDGGIAARPVPSACPPLAFEVQKVETAARAAEAFGGCDQSLARPVTNALRRLLIRLFHVQQKSFGLPQELIFRRVFLAAQHDGCIDCTARGDSTGSCSELDGDPVNGPTRASAQDSGRHGHGPGPATMSAQHTGPKGLSVSTSYSAAKVASFATAVRRPGHRRPPSARLVAPRSH